MSNLRQNQKGLAILELLLFIVVAAVIGGAAYYVGKNQNKTGITNKTTQTSQETSGVKDGWHLYTDAKAGYTLQLPDGWNYKKGDVINGIDGQPEKDEQGNTLYEPDKIIPDSSDLQSGTDGIMEVGTDTSTLSPLDYFKKNGFGRANYNGQGSSDNINGYNAYTAELDGQGGTAKVPVIIHAGKVVQFFYYTSSSMNKNADLCGQIISTIKFL